MAKVVHLRQLQLLETLESADQPIVPAFGAHQGHSPRHHWLIKAVHACSSNPTLLADLEATALRFGQTVTMAKSMRFWAIACKVIEPEQNGCYYPSRFGEQLLSEDGWDRYLENIASWWLLHWKLLRPPCYVPSWLALIGGTQPEFDEQQALELLIRFKGKLAPNRSNSALRQDLRCLLRMYIPDESRSIEDAIDHPFANLRLIYALPLLALDKRPWYGKNISDKKQIPPALLTYCCLDYAAAAQPASVRTISFSQLTWEEGSPGRAFLYPPSDLAESVGQYVSKLPDIHLTFDATHRPMLSYDRSARELAAEILQKFYADRQ